MMPSVLSTNLVGFPQLPSHDGYATDIVLNELSRQLAAANNTRRLSRGAGSQRAGNTMRVTKPGSANNSPRPAVTPRRRTLFSEGFERPHLQLVDANRLTAPASELHCGLSYEPEKRPARPMSWHPTSQQRPQPQPQQPRQQYPQQARLPYAFSNFNDPDHFASYQQLPPTPAAYSGYTSPASTFSPLSLPYSGVGSQQYYSPTPQTLPPQIQQQFPTPAYQHSQSPARGSASTLSSSELPSPPAPGVTAISVGSLDWDSFATHGFDKYAAPPTPEDFVVHPPTAKAAAVETSPKVARDEETMPFDSLDESEDEGEILYGMGLYDVPDRDPVLDFHRSAVFSLLGGAYPEPTGKGLKLEDAWEPPASDDEDEEEEDGQDEDADGDEQGE